MKAKEIIITHPLGNISAKAWGNPDAPKILAVHGWLDNAATFDFLGAELGKNHYFVAFDLPGHGKSSHRKSYGYHFVDWLCDVGMVIKELEWEDYALMGHSLGGAIVSFYTACSEHKPNHLVLLDGIAPAFDPSDDTKRRVKDYLKSVLTPEKSEKTIDLETAVMVRKKTGVDLPTNIAYKICERNLKGDSWQFDQKLKWPSPIRLGLHQIAHILEDFGTPCTVFWGEHSPFAYLREKIDTIIDMSKINQISVESGHYPHVDCVDEIVSELKKVPQFAY